VKRLADLLDVWYWINSFSILERIDVGETYCVVFSEVAMSAFSILERIDVGETL